MTSHTPHPSIAQSTKVLWLAEVLLLLAYFATRLFRLADLPPHIDEVFHVHRARDVWRLNPLYFVNTTKLLNVWLIALFYPFSAPYWVARVVSVFSGLLTLASIYKIAAIFYNRTAGLLSAFLYLVLPLTFWHDRLAVADPVATATGALVVLSSIWLARRATWAYALLVGLTLAATYLSKLTMLLVWPVPVLAWLLLRGRAVLAWRSVAHLIGAYGIGIALAAPVAIYSLLTSDLGVNEVQTSTQLSAAVLEVIAGNAGSMLANFRAYAGNLALLWLALALIIGLTTRKAGPLFLILAGGLPIVALLSLLTEDVTRYYLVGLPPLFALMGITAGLAWNWLGRVFPDTIPGTLRSLVGVLALIVLVAAYWPFFTQTYASPTTISLPQFDQRTYISGFPAGYGWDATVERLRQIAAESENDVRVVTSKEGHAWRTQIGLTGTPGIEVFYPEPLTSDWLADHLTDDVDVYFVRDGPRQTIDWPSLGVTAELVDSFVKPGGENWVELRRLTPVLSESETPS